MGVPWKEEEESKIFLEEREEAVKAVDAMAAMLKKKSLTGLK